MDECNEERVRRGSSFRFTSVAHACRSSRGMRVTSKHPTWEGLVPRVTRSFISFVTWTGPFGPRREGGGAWVTIVHGSLGSFVTSFHRYHSSLGPFFLTVFDRRARSARYTRFATMEGWDQPDEPFPRHILTSLGCVLVKRMKWA